jgi:hypothetical protein
MKPVWKVRYPHTGHSVSTERSRFLNCLHQQRVAIVANRLRGVDRTGRHQVSCRLEKIVNHDIRDDRKTWIESHATCLRCGNEAWANNYTIGARKSALIKLRESCPRKEKNFYFNQKLLEEEAEALIQRHINLPHRRS